MPATPYVETDCVFDFNGRKFESGGAVVTDDYIIAYLGENGTLNDWHGNRIGGYDITATWKTPRSFVSDCMHQVEAYVNGRLYTGRSAGVGMVYRGRLKRGQ